MAGSESTRGMLELDLAHLIAAKQVAVVQELDLGKLSAALKSIVDAVNSQAAGKDTAPTKGDFEALRQELEKLRDDLQGKDTEIEKLKATQACSPLPYALVLSTPAILEE